MITVQPSFYSEFHCLAGQCRDSCCQGWEIDIDGGTMALYRQTGGAFGERLRRAIKEQDGIFSFQLQEKDRCPFFNEHGLCDIYSVLGEEALCDICREHPRFYTCLPGRTEAGLGLCCEEARRLLFADDEPLALWEQDDGNDADPFTQTTAGFRRELFAILQNRNTPLWDRMEKVLTRAGQMQNELFSEPVRKKKDITSVWKALPDILAQTEPINSEWTDYIQAIRKLTGPLPGNPPVFLPSEAPYEKLLCYLLYRHFLYGADEGEIAAVTAFCVAGCCFTALSCRCLPGNAPDISDHAGMFSKQIEYSEENTAFLTQQAFSLYFA